MTKSRFFVVVFLFSDKLLDYHPHIHIIIAAASIDQKTKSWKTKNEKHLFNHKALAKVCRGKLLSKLTELNIKPPTSNKWIVDCKYVGKGNKAIVYLGRYLYRGVIKEKDIISCKDGKVTYRYINSKTKSINIKQSLAIILFT